MSYTKQTWATGDTVTAEKLNHIEDGIAAADGGGSSGGVIYCDLTGTGEGWSASMTIEEIGEAVNSGSTVLFRWEGVVGFLNYSEEEFPFADGNAFFISYPSSSEANLCFFSVGIDEEVNVSEDYYTLTPAT